MHLMMPLSPIQDFLTAYLTQTQSRLLQPHKPLSVEPLLLEAALLLLVHRQELLIYLHPQLARILLHSPQQGIVHNHRQLRLLLMIWMMLTLVMRMLPIA